MQYLGAHFDRYDLAPGYCFMNVHMCIHFLKNDTCTVYSFDVYLLKHICIYIPLFITKISELFAIVQKEACYKNHVKKNVETRNQQTVVERCIPN